MLRVSLLASVVLVGCVPPTYQVQRAVRVPHAASTLSTGQPVGGPVALTAGATSAANLVSPRKGTSEHAVEIPDQQVRGELRLRLGKRGEMGFIHERGIGATARKMDPTQAPVGEGDPHGTGVAMRYSARLDDKWSLGLELEALRWELPYVEYRTCVANCPSPITMVERGTASVPTLGVGITPSYRDGKWIVFGGAFARNHPTVERKATEYYEGGGDDDVEGGPLNVLVHAGAAYQFHPQVTAILKVDQNLSREPVRYGPTIGLALSAAVGE